MTIFIASICIVAGLGLILGLALALADKYIAVPLDEKQADIKPAAGRKLRQLRPCRLRRYG